MPVVKFKGNKLDPETIKALVAATLVNGSSPTAWWKRQSLDFRNTFMDTVRTSMRNGESLTQAINRIVGGTIDGASVPGIMKTTKAKAGALVSTSMSAVTNEAALKSFQANNDVIKAVTQLSTLDNRTSDVCIAYSGQTWNVNTLEPIAGSSLPFNGGPPRHFNCRSRLRPVTKSFKELGLDKDELPAGTRASMDGQVPADITFDSWLKKKGTTFQNDLLGPKRAQLWRDDKITLTQLVDMRGNPMTLTQLEQRAGLASRTRPAPTARSYGSVSDDFFVEQDVPGVGLRNFTKDTTDRDDLLVLVDRDVFEKGWSQSGTYIPADLSKNTIGNRYKDFGKFIEDEPIIKTGQVAVDDVGLISFSDGRHRTRWLLNNDMKQVPVTMSKESADNLSKYYGINLSTRAAQSQKAVERIAQLQREAQKARVARWKAEREAKKAKKAAEEAAAARKAKEAAERKAKKEAEEAARKAKEEAEKAAKKAKFEERKRAAEAKRAAREEAERRMKSTDPADVPTITGDPIRAGTEARAWLRRNGYSPEKIHELMGGPISIIDSFNPTIAQNMLRIMKEKVEASAKRVRSIKEATAAIPDEIPVFKTSREAMEWTEKHLMNRDNNILLQEIAEKGGRKKHKYNRKTGEYETTVYEEIVAWGNYDKKFYRVIAEVTVMMSKRFNMRLPNFLGVKSRHPRHRYKASKELAAVEMGTDSLLLPTTITNKAKVLQRTKWQEISNNNRWKQGGEKRLSDMLAEAKALKETGEDYADELIAAIEDAIKKKDFPFTATSIRGEAFDQLTDEAQQAMYIWDTLIHESGHRLHGQFKTQVDEVLTELFGRSGRGGYNPSRNRFLWQRQVSEYATENAHEFLAESFTRYMMGEHVRIYPPLLKLFKQLDNATDFGIDDISLLWKTEFKP